MSGDPHESPQTHQLVEAGDHPSSDRPQMFGTNPDPHWGIAFLWWLLGLNMVLLGVVRGLGCDANQAIKQQAGCRVGTHLGGPAYVARIFPGRD